MAIIADFPRVVIVALSYTIRHLSAFDVSKAFRQAVHFTEFKNKVHMLLNANTLTNLFVASLFLFGHIINRGL
jgi:DNA mismatch repair protein MSH3